MLKSFVLSSVVIYGSLFLGITSSNGAITVSGRESDIWLAGMPDGSTASLGDRAPDLSPPQVTGLTLNAGSVLAFSASGSVNWNAGIWVGPDGRVPYADGHSPGAENGMSDIIAPIGSLLGVFLGPDCPNGYPSPSALDFSTPVSRDFSVLAPEVRQVFYIGDGLTSTNIRQQFVIPSGATRLFLGTKDVYCWWDNAGSFTVNINPDVFAWKGGNDDTKTAWGVAGNWGTNAVPDQAGIRVSFGNQSSNNCVVDLVSSGRTVGCINFDPTTSTTIRSTYGYNLTLDNNGNISTIDVAGNHTISAPVVINNDLRISGSGTLNLSGGISGNHALTILNNVTVSSIRVNTLTVGNTVATQAVPEPHSLVMLLAIPLAGVLLWKQRYAE